MSCANDLAYSAADGATPARVRWSRLVRLVMAACDAFQEGLDMRRAALRSRPFSDE
jgi:coenzyme F420-reducing hydrogenase delta subunit